MGRGSVNFAPAQSGNGVYFLNCCVNGNNAYYKFTGATIGNIFNVSQGQITFYLKSRYSFAQRTANAAAPRYAFDVQDGNGHHLFYFLTQVSGGYLVLQLWHRGNRPIRLFAAGNGGHYLRQRRHPPGEDDLERRRHEPVLEWRAGEIRAIQFYGNQLVGHLGI